MNKGIIAFGVLAAAGLTGAVTQAEIQAADADALVTPAPAGVTEEVSQDTAIYESPSDATAADIEKATSAANATTGTETAGEDSQETGKGTGSAIPGTVTDQSTESGPLTGKAEGQTDSEVKTSEEQPEESETLTYTAPAATEVFQAPAAKAAAPQAAQMQGSAVENAAVTQNQLASDYVLVHATTGESGQDRYLKNNAQTVLNGKKLLGIYHNGTGGTASKEAENFYLSTKDYIGKAVFILNANGSLAKGGTAWVRDFLDFFHQFSGVKAICYETGHSPQSYDWTLVKPAYEVWSDQGTVNSGMFTGSVSGSTFKGNAAEWNAKAKPDKKQEYSVDMYRLYNVFSSEHLYTASPLERDVLKKSGAWNYEGIAWRNPLTGGNNVFRLYNPANSEHHYTTSLLERDSLRRAGWNYEGVGWLTDAAKSTAVYRLYNPHLKSGYHLFTTSKLEYDALTKMGWRQEGIAWYASKDFSTAKGSHYLYGNYAYDESGRQSGGIQKVGNDFYYANPDNGLKVEKREGLYKTAQGQIYVTGSGKLVKGQKQIGTSWKWFRPENALMAVNSFIDIPAAYNGSGPKTCYYDANGNMVKGEAVINGIHYKFDAASGALLRDIGKLQREVEAYINSHKAAGEIWSAALNVLDGTGSFLIHNTSQQSASSIKLFVMGAVYESYESLCGRYGSGVINSNLFNMIVYSDNNAWKYLVECLGGNGGYGSGCNVLSSWCRSKGYMDTYSTGGYGQNYTSVKDTASIVSDMYRGTLRYSQNMLDLMKKQTRTWKIPAGLPAGVISGNKTGELGDTENDTAIVYSQGAPYVLSVMSTSLTSTYRAQMMIREISSMVYRAINA
ncbi:serine hydrolase [Faecalibaculum rodentium]|uniref:serine hydrolase n=1 Tax=Faecalibaculum rodentium TaxID=1702221 RepID=UPI0023F296CD|nr:serine hydrolase [Faecalibaculum rodentium]